MINQFNAQKSEYRELPPLSIEALSIGKNKKDQSLNEDLFVVAENTFAVIDGSRPRVPIDLNGKNPAQFAASIVADVLLETNSDINGVQLVKRITKKLGEEINKIGLKKYFIENPYARPAALFTTARIFGNKLIITALGDVGCRVNGKIIHSEYFESEKMMTNKRIKAMKSAYIQDPLLSNDKLFEIGLEAISKDLIDQASFFNNPKDKLGLGIINGEKVPEKFIKVYEFNLDEIDSFEIFSDGYFILPNKNEIADWEKRFREGENEDLLRWQKYPAVKGAYKDNFCDDRTVLILTRVK